MKENGPWKILSSEVKYTNPWIEVREDQVLQPDGNPGIYGVVSQKPGVSVLALDAEGYVYLVREFRYALERYSLETISGAIEEGELPIDAARRELEEEAGIKAEEFTDMGRIDPQSSALLCPMHLFLAQNLTFVPHARETVEVMEVEKIKYTDALERAMNGEITFAPGLILLLKTAHLLVKKVNT